MAYTMFTLWIAGTIVSLAVAFLLLRVLYPKEEEEMADTTASESQEV